MQATSWPFLDHPGPIPFAHRGAHLGSRVAENSMGAFEAAVRLGYRYVETDVHATRDGVLVTFHDHRLDRLTGRPGHIAEVLWSEVRRLRLPDGQPIALLEDVLTTWPELRLNIDPKHDQAVVPLVDVLQRAGSLDRVCVSAFSQRRLATFRDLTAGQVCTALGPVEVARLRAAGAGANLRLGSVAGCVQVPERAGRVPLVDRRLLAAAHNRHLQVHVWTVNSDERMRSLLDLGVDGIMTDRPRLLKELLAARGQWYG